MPIRVFDATRAWVEHLSALRLLGQLTWAFRACVTTIACNLHGSERKGRRREDAELYRVKCGAGGVIAVACAGCAGPEPSGVSDSRGDGAAGFAGFHRGLWRRRAGGVSSGDDAGDIAVCALRGTALGAQDRAAGAGGPWVPVSGGGMRAGLREFQSLPAAAWESDPKFVHAHHATAAAGGSDASAQSSD